MARLRLGKVSEGNGACFTACPAGSPFTPFIASERVPAAHAVIAVFYRSSVRGGDPLLHCQPVTGTPSWQSHNSARARMPPCDPDQRRLDLCSASIIFPMHITKEWPASRLTGCGPAYAGGVSSADSHVGPSGVVGSPACCRRIRTPFTPTPHCIQHKHAWC